MQSDYLNESISKQSVVKFDLENLTRGLLNEQPNESCTNDVTTSTLTWHNINVYVRTSQSKLLAKLKRQEPIETRKQIIKNSNLELSIF
jgi:hypothetical protein